LRGAKAAGVEIKSVEIDPTGKIVIQLEGGKRVAPSDALDKWMANRAHAA
jgi:hypothetical protein